MQQSFPPFSFKLLTVIISLVRVGYQSAVVRSRWQKVRNTVVVIVIITLVAHAILVRIQLGAIDHQGTIILGVLMAVTITAEG